MQQQGKRPVTFTRRHWACGCCGRTGLILVHRDDSAEKAAWRRAQSHAAQVRRDRCAGHDLRWYTTSEELDCDAQWTGALTRKASAEYARGYNAGYGRRRRQPPSADAVDPSAEVLERGPRATDLLDSTETAAPAPPPEGGTR